MQIKISFLGLFLPIAVFTLMVIGWYGSIETDRELGRIRNQELLHVGLGSGELKRSVQAVTLDLKFLAQHRALHKAIESNTAENLGHAEADWAVISNAKATYDQMRWIDETGMERIRVDYKNGAAVIVPTDKLQNKASRYFFIDAIKLDPGDIFVSPLDLNIEQGAVELPYKPMLRVATPVVDSRGHTRGIVVLNYYGRMMLDAFAEATHPVADHMMLLNGDGYWLKSPKVADEWGFMFSRADLSLAAQSPAVWADVRAGNAGQRVGHDGLWTWQTVYPLLQSQNSTIGSTSLATPALGTAPEAQYAWKIVSWVSAQTLVQMRSAIWTKLSLLGALLLSLMGFGSWKLSKSWALQANAEAEIRRINAGLELAVSERTSELRHTVAKLDQEVTERKQSQEALRIAATAFESQQGIMVTNAKRRILKVNKAFTEITGYHADEVIGKSPRMLSSNRQDTTFYEDMWQHIYRNGSWQGELWNKRKNGEIYPEWLNISEVKDAAGEVTHYVGAFSDRSYRKVAEQRIESLAFYDALTELPNRTLLIDRLKHALAASVRHRRHGALLLVDLDNFKTINDAHGHDQGDLLIQQVANRLRHCVRESDTLARVGGDKFMVLIEDASHNDQNLASDVKVTGDKILNALRQPYEIGGGRHHSSASIGITLFDGSDQNHIEEPLKQVELAMYQAKTAGRDTLRFFNPQMQANVSARADLESRLREAIAQNQFLLHYQPQVDGINTITGAEVLLRWLDPKLGLIPPAEFIPAAEETRLILPIGQWVLDTACRELARWANHPKMAHLTISVNVSARQFGQHDFVEQVLDTVKRTGANPHRLKLELTESMLVDDVESVIAKMSALKSTGVNFSLDDFGTGYSSLAYLKRLPLDQLKIDQGFVRDILIDPNDAAIARMVIALAESMKLSVIAEGVETTDQRDFLSQLGCPSYQGFLFSKPIPLGEFEALVKVTTSW